MTEGTDHVLLTRFNLPSGGAESFVRARPGWLRQRVALFEEFCVPSVRAQVNQRFHWIVYFDPKSPDWLRARIDEHCKEGLYTAVFRTSVSHGELLADLRRVTSQQGQFLLTTNLDNDDGLAIDFTDRVQHATCGDERSAIYVVHGLIKSDKAVYAHTDRHNAFCSVRENWDSPSTCWADWHNLLPRQMATVEIGGEPGWLQVIHGVNVSNRVRGGLVDPRHHLARFPGLIDDVSVPTRLALARDRVLERPWRVVRDSVRAAAKSVAMAFLGKEGIDHLKDFMARSTRTRHT